MKTLDTLASALASVFCLALILGCSPPYETAEVDGILYIDGKPGHKVFIQFIPDVDAGTHGPTSTAETDESGYFSLELNDSNGTIRPGAVVGRHRVTLSDLQLAESATGTGVPIRFAASYSLPGSTPMTQDITPGNNTIELKVVGQASRP